MIELLRGYFQIEPRDDTRKIREKVTGKLLSLDRLLELAVPPLFSLLDVPLEDAEWTGLDPAQRRQRTLDALKRLFLRESQVQPLVVVFEDLHWIDGETQAMLDGLVESLPTARMLLLVNYRPEYQHGWGSKTYYRQLRVDALPAASAENLLQALLGKDPSLAPLGRLLIGRTEGNPLFLEESVRTLVETRILVGEPGAYHLTRAPDSFEIPATAQAIIAARVDRLEPEDKRLLQAASVLGKDVPLVLLEAITDIREDELRPRLGRLQAAEFLYEARLFPEVEYTFKHALTHEVTYGGVLRDRRRTLHARISGAIETLFPDRLAEYAERLAQHALGGEEWEKAVRYGREAGAKSLARWAQREAAQQFEQVLAALRHLPMTKETVETEIDVRLALRAPLMSLGRLPDMASHLEHAKTQAETLGNQRRLAKALCLLGHHAWVSADPDGAIEAEERAQTIAAAMNDAGLQMAATSHLGLPLHALGQYQRASECFLTVLRVPMPLLGAESPAIFGGFLVWCLAETGAFSDGLARANEARRIAEESRNPHGLIHAYLFLGILNLRRGVLDEAVGSLEHSLRVAEEVEFPFYLPWIASSLAYAHVLSARIIEGVALLERTIERAASMGVIVCQSLWNAYLSEAYLMAGRNDDAVVLAKRALDFSLQHKERGHQAWTLRLLGDIEVHQRSSRPETIAAYYEDGLRLAIELGMRPVVAHCHLGLGKLYRRMDKLEKAREHLATATTMYREMDMRFWPEQAEAATREFK